MGSYTRVKTSSKISAFDQVWLATWKNNFVLQGCTDSLKRTLGPSRCPQQLIPRAWKLLRVEEVLDGQGKTLCTGIWDKWNNVLTHLCSCPPSRQVRGATISETCLQAIYRNLLVPAMIAIP